MTKYQSKFFGTLKQSYQETMTFNAFDVTVVQNYTKNLIQQDKHLFETLSHSTSDYVLIW